MKLLLKQAISETMKSPKKLEAESIEYFKTKNSLLKQQVQIQNDQIKELITENHRLLDCNQKYNEHINFLHNENLNCIKKINIDATHLKNDQLKQQIKIHNDNFDQIRNQYKELVKHMVWNTKDYDKMKEISKKAQNVVEGLKQFQCTNFQEIEEKIQKYDNTIMLMRQQAQAKDQTILYQQEDIKKLEAKLKAQQLANTQLQEKFDDLIQQHNQKLHKYKIQDKEKEQQLRIIELKTDILENQSRIVQNQYQLVDNQKLQSELKLKECEQVLEAYKKKIDQQKKDDIRNSQRTCSPLMELSNIQDPFIAEEFVPDQKMKTSSVFSNDSRFYSKKTTAPSSAKSQKIQQNKFDKSLQHFKQQLSIKQSNDQSMRQSANFSEKL